MLLERADHSLAQRSDVVLQELPYGLMRHTSPETHAAVVELATGVHADVGGATAELASLRKRFWIQRFCGGTFNSNPDSEP